MFPIGDLWKREVRGLAKYRVIPEEFLGKKPSADLWKGQTDEGELGLSYEEMDSILGLLEKGKASKAKADFGDKKIKKLKERMGVNRHKSLPTPVIKVH